MTTTIDLTNPAHLREAAQAAHIAGNVALSQVYDALADALDTIDVLEDVETLERWEKNNGSAESYKEFFYDCFERLAGCYPCPSVTSDYDKGIIFETIEKGAAL